MNAQIINARVKTLADKAGDRLQSRAFLTAGVIDGAKRPARKLNSAGKKLNDLSHRFYDRLLEQQISGFEDVVDAGTKRLKLIGDAASLRELVQSQIALFPVNREQFANHLRGTVGIIGDTGRELANLARTTVADLKGGKTVARKTRKPAAKRTAKSARPAAKSAASKATRKPAARKKAGGVAKAGKASIGKQAE